MNIYEDKLKKYISKNGIQAEHLSFKQSCHSVEDAVKAANADIDEFVKNICLIDDKRDLIVAIVKGEDRVNTAKIAKILKIEKPAVATVDEILQKTGYPVGGIPSFGYNAIFLIDPKVMEKQIVYTGGGSENSLTKISTSELQKANQGQVTEIRK